MLLILIPSSLVFSYVFFGGFSSVTKTDILQLVFVFVFLLLPVIYFSLGTITSNQLVVTSHQFSEMPLNLMILLSISLIYLPISQDINIRVKSASSIPQARKGLLIGALFYGLIIFTSVFIGISLAEHGVEIKDTEQALSMFFKTHYPQIGVAAILAAMAAIISTLDSTALNAITSLSNDILPKFSLLKKMTQKQFINTSGGIIFVLAISVALFFNQILTLILTALLIYISTLIPIALGKKLKVNDSHIFASSIILIGLIILIEITKYEILLKAIVYPAIGVISLMLFYIAKLIARN